MASGGRPGGWLYGHEFAFLRHQHAQAHPHRVAEFGVRHRTEMLEVVLAEDFGDDREAVLGGRRSSTSR